jgi:hypothetical protein
MSTTSISFSTTLIIGEQTVPLLSEVVIGDGNSQDGDPPVVVFLGDVISFIEQKLGAGAGMLSQNPQMALITEAFPSLTPSTFNSTNQTVVNVYEFTLNSSTNEFLFSFNLNITNSDPTQGLIQFPAVFNNWLSIRNIAVSFSAGSSSSPNVTLSSKSIAL